MSLLIAFVFFQARDLNVARREIQAQYDALDRGFRTRNPAALDHLMTEDFSTESPEGKRLGREEARKSFTGLMMAGKAEKWPRKVVKVTVSGEDVVALVRGHFHGQLPGRDGKLHVTDLESTVEDTWTHTPDGWEIRRSEMRKMVMKSDGKVVVSR